MKSAAISFLLVLSIGVSVTAQEKPKEEVLQLEVTPSELTLDVGQKASLKATVKDDAGQMLETTVVFFSRARRNVGVNAQGEVTAYRPGDFVVVALVPTDPEDEPRRAKARVSVEVPVTVRTPPVKSIQFEGNPGRFYVGTTVSLKSLILDESDTLRQDVGIEYSSSNPSVARVDRFGRLTLLSPGDVEIRGKAEQAEDTLKLRVEANPVAELTLTASEDKGRTGDVIHFEAVPRDAQGQAVPEMPVNYSVSGETSPTILAAGAAALITSDGRFVAERSGVFTVSAISGAHTATYALEISPRDVRQEVEILGQGAVRDRHTSDFWVWEGNNGHDYAITGTWGADGHAYIWDVTDPTHMSIIDVVRVDARTVNDVKVSEDGKLAIISREGASNRKNGLVILDVSDPTKGVTVLSTYDDQLTGGVHNLFISKDHVYALSAGRRYDVINIEDPSKPTRVGRFELDTPGHGIHDVWISDGIAYSSNWTDGVVAVDVGGGKKGGSPKNPVKLGSYAYPSGWNHAAYPYRSKSTGKFYVFAGDEAFPYGGLSVEKGGKPGRAAGWIHVIEWDDWENPREVARYQVPEAGTHNLWVEDDVLYVAYYNGGLRVVDVSGELMGDLYKQGREIAFWIPFDPEGYLANAPFTWGPQPFKGNIFMSDWNSGLWAVRLKPKDGKTKFIGEPQ